MARHEAHGRACSKNIHRSEDKNTTHRQAARCAQYLHLRHLVVYPGAVVKGEGPQQQRHQPHPRGPHIHLHCNEGSSSARGKGWGPGAGNGRF